MQHILFDPFDPNIGPPFKVGILIKTGAMSKGLLELSYVDPIIKATGLKHSDFVALDLDYNPQNKAPAALVKACVANLTKVIEGMGIQILLIADATYYKAFTADKNSKTAQGYAKPATDLPGVNCIVVPNYQSLFYNPAGQHAMDLGINAASELINTGAVKPLGSDIIHGAYYPADIQAISDALDALHFYPELSSDIEGFSLNFWECGLGTITFCWNQHNGIAFPIDYVPLAEPMEGTYGTNQKNFAVRKLLRKFFDTYKGKITYHGSTFDVKVLIFELYMDSEFDNFDGMMLGLDTLYHNIDDTKQIAYLATNNTAKNELGLKHLAHEFAGNYAQGDINDITKIPLTDLLKYNLIDGLATNYVKAKYWPVVLTDQQEEIYRTIFMPSIPVITQMELTGVPICKEATRQAQRTLEAVRQEHTQKLLGTSWVKQCLLKLRQNESDVMHAKWKAKTAPIEHFNYIVFNPNSPNQLQVLLYEVMGLPVVDKTDTGAPATGKDTLLKLKEFLDGSDESKLIIDSLIEIGAVAILLDNFINAFLTKSVWHPKLQSWFIHGNFNLGGTVSGRLSSNNPNLQNMPNTGNKYAKIVKACIRAPAGYLLVGADFNALEDRISALTTRDPNKLRVYTDGYDSHCLRAAYYFRKHMPDIDVDSVESINSIATKYKQWRQDSKPVTFLLTYQGTFIGLMNNCGFDRATALEIEASYHEMYKVSDDWVQSKIEQACKDGYVTVAFGLRLRTPLLKQVVYGSAKMPYEARKEGRTAGNALGQSYGLLNNRAAIELKSRLDPTKYRTRILPIMHIHDASYQLVKNNLENVHWLNTHLPECMKWQELPEIQHDVVKLGGSLEIYYPNWTKEYAIPNGATIQEIYEICQIKP